MAFPPFNDFTTSGPYEPIPLEAAQQSNPDELGALLRHFVLPDSNLDVQHDVGIDAVESGWKDDTPTEAGVEEQRCDPIDSPLDARIWTQEEEETPDSDESDSSMECASPLYTELVDADVLCGRATKQIEMHPGNRFYRELIEWYKPHYQEKRGSLAYLRYYQSQIVDSVLRAIALTGGRFVQKIILRPNGNTGRCKEHEGEKGATILYRIASQIFR